MSKSTTAIPFFKNPEITPFDKRVTAIKTLKKVHLENMNDMDPPVPSMSGDVFRWYHIQTLEQREAFFYMFQEGVGETYMNENLPLPSVVFVQTTDAKWLEIPDYSEFDPNVLEWSYYGTLATIIKDIEEMGTLLSANGLYNEIAGISGETTAIKIAFNLLPLMDDSQIFAVTGVSLAKLSVLRVGAQMAAASFL